MGMEEKHRKNGYCTALYSTVSASLSKDRTWEIVRCCPCGNAGDNLERIELDLLIHIESF